MSQAIIIGTRVICQVGEAKGSIHFVLSITRDEIITWSEDPESLGGFSWLGHPADFLTQFTPAL